MPGVCWTRCGSEIAARSTRRTMPRPRRSHIYHSPWLDGALLRAPMPMVVTLHDLFPLKCRGEFLRTGMRLKMRLPGGPASRPGDRPDHAPSPTTRCGALGIPAERIEVIGEAADPVFHPRPADQVALGARARIACPSATSCGSAACRRPEPRKRIAALAKAKRSMPLVLVGPASPWAHELPDVTLTDQRLRRRPGRDLLGRACARVPEPRTRASGSRWWRRWRAEPRSRHRDAPGGPRGARRPRRALRDRRHRRTARGGRACPSAGPSAARGGPGRTPPRRPGTSTRTRGTRARRAAVLPAAGLSV